MSEMKEIEQISFPYKITSSGNTPAIYLPREVRELLDITVGDYVEVTIKPIKRNAKNLIKEE